MVTLLSTNGFTMANNKPEWIEIAENDGPARPAKASKALPLAAVLASALILGVGAVVGHVNEGSPVVAADTTSVQSQATSATPVASNSQSSLVTRIANPAVSAVAIATSGLQNPSIAQLPTRNGDDDEDDDDEDGEDEGDDD